MKNDQVRKRVSQINDRRVKPALSVFWQPGNRPTFLPCYQVCTDLEDKWTPENSPPCDRIVKVGIECDDKPMPENMLVWMDSWLAHSQIKLLYIVNAYGYDSCWSTQKDQILDWASKAHNTKIEIRYKIKDAATTLHGKNIRAPVDIGEPNKEEMQQCFDLEQLAQRNSKLVILDSSLTK